MLAEVRGPCPIVCTNHLEAGPALAFADAMALERDLIAKAAAAAAEPAPALTVALWQTEQTLVLPSGMLRTEGFARAGEAFRGRGWPLLERDTGGDLTPQFDGVLNISMAFVLKGRERSIANAYRMLTDPLVHHLESRFGIPAYTASVPGAFCDGAYNLVVGGRKLAGTAQRWRLVTASAGTEDATAVLAHAAMLCTGDLETALQAGNTLLAMAGETRRIDPSAHVRLADLIAAEKSAPAAVARSLSAFFATTYPATGAIAARPTPAMA